MAAKKVNSKVTEKEKTVFNYEGLIKLVRDHEALYNARHKDYKNIHMAANVWEEIGKKLRVPGKSLIIVTFPCCCTVSRSHLIYSF